MPAADTAKLLASLELQDKFSPGVNKALGSVGKLDKSMSGLSLRAQAFGTALGFGIERLAERGIGLLVDNVQSGVAALQRAEEVQNATLATIRSTGNAAGQSATQIHDYAQNLENLTTVDDKVIQSGENMLLTFTNIKGNIFPAATKAALDLALGMAQGNASAVDLKSSTIQLGKALNDPIKGIAALTRVGVAFTAEQKETIKSLVGTGNAITDLKTVGVQLSASQKQQVATFGDLADAAAAASDLSIKLTDAQKAQLKTMADGTGLMKAQQIVLAEVEKEFSGFGKAAGEGAAADMRRLQDAVEDAQMSLAQGLLPAINELRKSLTVALADPATQAQLREFGKGLGEAIKGAVALVRSLPWATIRDVLGGVATAAKAALDFFSALPPWVQTAVVTGWGLNKLTGGAVTDILGGFVKGVLGINAGVVNVTGATVTVPGGGGLPGVPTVPVPGLRIVGPEGPSSGIRPPMLPLGGATIVIDQASTDAFVKSTADKLFGPNRVGSPTALRAFGEHAVDRIVDATNEANKKIGAGLTQGHRDMDKLEAGIAGLDSTVTNELAKVTDKLHTDLAAQLDAFRSATSPKAAAAAAAAIVADILKGAGGVQSNTRVLSQLQAARATATDPGLTKALDDAIAKIGGHIKGEEWIAAQKEAARKIVDSNKPVKEKLDALERIESQLKSRGDTNAANIVQKLEDVVAAIGKPPTVNVTVNSGTTSRSNDKAGTTSKRWTPVHSMVPS